MHPCDVGAQKPAAPQQVLTRQTKPVGQGLEALHAAPLQEVEPNMQKPPPEAVDAQTHDD